MHDFPPYLPLIGAFLGLLTLWGAFRAGRRRRLVENLPTSKTTGVFIGLVVFKGTAEAGNPLTSFWPSNRVPIIRGASTSTGRGPSPKPTPTATARRRPVLVTRAVGRR